MKIGDTITISHGGNTFTGEIVSIDDKHITTCPVFPSKSPMLKKIVSTCQICGREIKLNKYGKISRHGYKQNKLTKLVSSPCLGSHHDPYEVSCYEIKRTIDGLTKAIALNKQKLNELHDKPPSFFHVTSNAIGSIYGAIHVLKPDNFSPTDVTEGEYYKIYRREQSDLMLRIKQFNEQIIYLTYRLNKWIKE